MNKKPFCANQNDAIKKVAVVMRAIIKRLTVYFNCVQSGLVPLTVCHRGSKVGIFSSALSSTVILQFKFLVFLLYKFQHEFFLA